MSDLKLTVSMPFKRKGKETLRETEFIMALSMDLSWFPPEQARNVLGHAEKEGLIKREGDLIRPTFDISSLELPSGFIPDDVILEKKTIFERTIDRIILATGMDKRKVISMINKKQEDMSKLVKIEVSAILVAIEHGVLVDDLLKEEYKEVINPSTSS